MTIDERRARLARRHLLSAGDRRDDPVEVTDALVALHSTDPVTVYLSIAARSAEPSLASVDAALHSDRRLIRHHAMRRTLWVAPPATVRAMHSAATRALAGIERRRTCTLLAAAGVADPAAWLTRAEEQVLDALRTYGPSNARRIGDLVPDLKQQLMLAPGTTYSAGQSAHTRVLLGLGFEGRVLRGRPSGSWISGAYEYVLAEDWLPGGLDADHDGPVTAPGKSRADQAAAGLRASAALLARAYLRRFGPVTTTDLAWWAGWTQTLTKRALADIGAVQVEAEDAAAVVPAWLAADDTDPVPDPGPWVAALPSLDPTIMGWKLRSWYLPEAAAGTFDRNGNGGASLWVDGRVVGVWAQDGSGALRTSFFESVPGSRRAQLDERLEALREVLGPTRFTFRYAGPAQRALLT